MADASIGSATLGNAPGGLMESLNTGGFGEGALSGAARSGAPLATATDLLFGEPSAIAQSNVVTDAAAEFLGNAGNAAGGAFDRASGAFDGASGALPSATDALFGGAGLGDLFDVASSGLGNTASGAIDAISSVDAVGTIGDLGSDVASGIGESVGDAASSAGEGVADLVSDGIGSLISSIFS
jgi:hypothetical protein